MLQFTVGRGPSKKRKLPYEKEKCKYYRIEDSHNKSSVAKSKTFAIHPPTMSLSQRQSNPLATAVVQPSLIQQVGMAGTAAVITVTFIHPIDVIKVRTWG
jgi:hypothetical protein